MTAEAPAQRDTSANAGPHPGTTAHDGTAARPGGRLRTSDAERSAAVDVLQDAVARGLLTHDEGGERMATALAAKFRDELPPLIADLPPAPAAASAPPTAAGWRNLGSSVVTQVRSDLRAATAAGPRSRRFLITALVALLALGFLIGMISLAVHGLFDGGGFDDHGFDGDGFGHHGGFDPQ
jgi:hypothetical protein